MSLKYLTSRDAVLKALAEYDQLGEKAFLRKYGFHPARTTFLVHEGRRYASKAVCSAAYSYQYPSDPPLPSFAFSGGEHSVKPKLEKLGFVVLHESQWPIPEKQVDGADEKVQGSRNPPWRREELILALEFYLTYALAEHDKANAAIEKLSDTLNKLPFQTERPDAERLRNTNSCQVKLANFRALDPNYEEKDLDTGSELDKAIWDEFCDDQERLHREADTIRALVTNPETLSEVSYPEEGEESHKEGALKYRLHRARERSSKVVEQAKKLWGKDPKCEVCGLSFGKAYPGIGEGFVEAHHRIPLADLGVQTETKPRDLAPVCANCHRMLHWKGGTTIETLRTTIGKETLPLPTLGR